MTLLTRLERSGRPSILLSVSHLYALRGTSIPWKVELVLIDDCRGDETAAEHVITSCERFGAKLGRRERNEHIRLTNAYALSVALFDVPPTGHIHGHDCIVRSVDL